MRSLLYFTCLARLALCTQDVKSARKSRNFSHSCAAAVSKSLNAVAAKLEPYFAFLAIILSAILSYVALGIIPLLTN